MATRSPRKQQRSRQDVDPNAPAMDSQRVRAETRSERVPLGVPRRQLEVPQREGYRRRWVNDDGKGRLQAALRGGYSYVADPSLRVGEDDGQSRSDSRVSRIVGRTQDGKPMRAFLMELPRELFEEDQRSKQSALDEVDRAIRKGRLVPQGEEHRYIPDEGRGIKVERELKKHKPGSEADAE